MSPIDVSRPFTMLAIEAAMQTRPPFIAVFARRSVDIQRSSAGCASWRTGSPTP